MPCQCMVQVYSAGVGVETRDGTVTYNAKGDFVYRGCDSRSQAYTNKVLTVKGTGKKELRAHFVCCRCEI